MKSPPQLRMYMSGNLICPRSLHVYRWLWKCHKYLFEVTNKFLRVGKFATIEFPNNGIVLLKAEKAMASHSSTPAWKIPWTEGPDGLQSMGSLGVRHDWATSLYFFTFMHWRRKWQLTPVFLPGEFQGGGSLVVFRLWGHTELDKTEAT